MVQGKVFKHVCLSIGEGVGHCQKEGGLCQQSTPHGGRRAGCMHPTYFWSGDAITSNEKWRNYGKIQYNVIVTFNVASVMKISVSG